MPKKILIALSEAGYWGEELVAPLKQITDSGYTADFVTRYGLRPIALPVSKDPTFVDPPLGKIVVSEEMAKRTAEIDDPHNTRLANPIKLRAIDDTGNVMPGWFPLNPYPSSATYLREREAYFKLLDARKAEIKDKYDAILLVGGSGACMDMANDFQFHDLIRCFFELGKPIAAVCYGVACLAFTQISDDDERSIIYGKHVTGHPAPYDYQYKSAFWDRTRNDYVNTDCPPYKLQMILKTFVGPDGLFHGNVGKEVSVIVDYPFITGRSTGDSEMTGKKLIDALENGEKRYGW